MTYYWTLAGIANSVFKENIVSNSLLGEEDCFEDTACLF